MCFLVLKTLSLNLSVYTIARVQGAKSNFLLCNLVPLYWQTPAEDKGHRLVSCFGRSWGVGITSEATLGSCCCHSSSSCAVILTCRSLRKKPAVIMNFGQSGSKVLGYSLRLPYGTFEERILTTRLWLGSRGNTGNWLWRAQYAQPVCQHSRQTAWQKLNIQYRFASQPKQFKNFRVLDKCLQLKLFF